jgi:hypothetical protein
VPNPDKEPCEFTGVAAAATWYFWVERSSTSDGKLARRWYAGGEVGSSFRRKVAELKARASQDGFEIIAWSRGAPLPVAATVVAGEDPDGTSMTAQPPARARARDFDSRWDFDDRPARARARDFDRPACRARANELELSFGALYSADCCDPSSRSRGTQSAVAAAAQTCSRAQCSLATRIHNAGPATINSGEYGARACAFSIHLDRRCH